MKTKITEKKYYHLMCSNPEFNLGLKMKSPKFFKIKMWLTNLIWEIEKTNKT